MSLVWCNPCSGWPWLACRSQFCWGLRVGLALLDTWIASNHPLINDSFPSRSVSAGMLPVKPKRLLVSCGLTQGSNFKETWEPLGWTVVCPIFWLPQFKTLAVPWSICCTGLPMYPSTATAQPRKLWACTRRSPAYAAFRPTKRWGPTWQCPLEWSGPQRRSSKCQGRWGWV